MIDSKEKMKHCLKIEKENYYPGGEKVPSV